MLNAEDGLTLPEVELAMSKGPTGLLSTSPEVQLTPDEYLLQAIEGHINAERSALTQYRDLAEKTKDPVVELIMGIVLEDEERHHSLLRRLAARLEDDLFWRHSAEALAAPSTTPEDPANSESIRESLRKFVASERRGVYELEDFAGRADGLYGGLPTELLEMMALDSQKHEHLLRFLFHRVSDGIAEAQRSE
ncbi:MAG TPA: ferritin family protein [Chloroflexota bacterium]|jgi:rubrerythrin|nr:ferritin family protein [Chloroflexota bacterium]